MVSGVPPSQRQEVTSEQSRGIRQTASEILYLTLRNRCFKERAEKEGGGKTIWAVNEKLYLSKEMSWKNKGASSQVGPQWDAILKFSLLFQAPRKLHS